MFFRVRSISCPFTLRRITKPSSDKETNSKVVDFLDITFTLNNGIYKPYKKPNDIYKQESQPPATNNQPTT